jgi:hypothetical protein
MVAVQGENTADVDGYQLKTSTFYEMSTYTLQEGVIKSWLKDFTEYPSLWRNARGR